MALTKVEAEEIKGKLDELKELIDKRVEDTEGSKDGE